MLKLLGITYVVNNENVVSNSSAQLDNGDI